MKRQAILLCILCVFIFAAGKSQGYKFIYYLDVNFSSVQKAKAVIVGRAAEDNGLLKVECFGISNDQHLMTAHFKDSTLSTLQGIFKSYHPNGRVEKEGNYNNNNEEGIWQEWDSTGIKTDSTIYKNGLVYTEATFQQHKNGSLSYFTIKDSLQDTYKTTSWDEHGVVNEEVFFKGEKGILKKYTTTGIQTDSLFTREESEAIFPGGDAAWSLYLMQNLDADVPAKGKAPVGKYAVIIKFIVRPDGSLADIKPETNIGYGMEKEALRIIRNSPKWIPAVQYGRKVNAYRRQPITFQLEGE